MSAGAAPLIPADWLTWISRLPAEGGPSGADWARGAQRLLGEAFERWDLVPDGPLRTGWTAVVAPVRRDGDLQITDETGTQALGLTDLRVSMSAHDGNWTLAQALAGGRNPAVPPALTPGGGAGQQPPA